MMNTANSWVFRQVKVMFFRFILIAGLIQLLFASEDVIAQNRKIAIFGSSVANGSGDTTDAGGYAGLIGKLLEKKDWQVVNVSRGGDNTTKILPRFDSQLLPEKPKYVILGLSLGNEGIATTDLLARNRSFEKFRSGLFHLVQLCRNNGMYPVVVNCYARGDFQPEQYAAVKKMNLIINTWDVPSINVLGPIDNGKGNWLEGYYHDKSHPDYKGHQEMFFAFVPSLFEAIEAGKTVPYKIRSSGYLTVSQTASARPLRFTPDNPIHSFSVSFLVKTKGNGTIAAIRGEKASGIEIGNGKLIYHAMNSQIICNDTTGENKGWQYVVVTHQHATGQTAFYINGKLAGTVIEIIDFKEFVLGGSGEIPPNAAPDVACYKDLLIYRSNLNCDEVRALYDDQLLQSSLEIYAPLNDRDFSAGMPVANYAQSLSKLIIDGDSLKADGQ
jgi:lysophospholipase L1-like esterase